ncbi:MAG: Y-family DNA polymerase [Steroidobacteraceae bacterium]
MKSRAVISATADLFAAVDATAVQRPVLAPTPPLAPTPTPPFAPARVAALPPPPQAVARSRSKHVWYAVVFPKLNEAEQSAAVLQRLCLHAQQFTSLVSVEMPNALLLEIKGSVKLFGSLEELHAGLDTAWSRLKLCAHSATAPSPLAALWFARAGKPVLIEDPGLLAGALAELPVACTSWDAERLHTLRAMGVTRLGELLRLPRAGMARRLSAAALRDLDIALARQAAPRRAFVPRERFRERCDFEMEIETVAYLLKALEPLIGRCAQFLRERQAGVQTLELRLRHRARPATRVRLGLASITSEQRRVADVLAQKLSRLELAAPALSMELLAGPLQPLSPGSLDVFAPLGRAGGCDTAPQLVERLRARLGEEAVYGICSIPEHRPEAAWQRVRQLHLDSALRVGGRMTSRDMIEHDLPRPVWLLNEPARLCASQCDWILEHGPERIETGWWDGKDIARDYYIARQTGGTRLWIFQERQSQCWYLHGVFA